MNSMTTATLPSVVFMACLSMANAAELLADPDPLLQDIALQEGLSEVPYKDSRGFLTIGYGHRITAGSQALRDMGYTHSDVPELVFVISHQEALDLLRADVKIATDGCRRIFGSAFDLHPEPVRHALIHMAFQLGTTGLSKFTHMRTYINRGDYVKAAAEALHSQWARHQTPERARHVTMMMAQGARK